MQSHCKPPLSGAAGLYASQNPQYQRTTASTGRNPAWIQQEDNQPTQCQAPPGSVLVARPGAKPTPGASVIVAVYSLLLLQGPSWLSRLCSRLSKRYATGEARCDVQQRANQTRMPGVAGRAAVSAAVSVRVSHAGIASGVSRQCVMAPTTICRICFCLDPHCAACTATPTLRSMRSKVIQQSARLSITDNAASFTISYFLSAPQRRI